MADVQSLGPHKPAALPYLIDEGYLPQDPSRDLYQWETYVVDEDHDQVEEEVLATKDCVVWSQSGLVRAAYRFELEGEHVRQAILTRFPDAAAALQTQEVSQTKEQKGGYGRVLDGFGKNSRRSIVPDQVRHIQKDTRETGQDQETSSRALVVFLKTKAHVYFLHGSHHIINLPFEIEKAFAAPRGLLLQRKLRACRYQDYASSKVPPAPQNSFFSQPTTQTSFLLSPALGKSFTNSQPVRPSPLGNDGKTNDWLNNLYDSVCGPQNQADESEAAGLYTLANPLSDFGLVVEPLPSQTIKPSSQPASIDFDALDPAEKIIYISPSNELPQTKSPNPATLTLIVTLNPDLRLTTLWQTWYLPPHALSSLVARRRAHKSAKVRRRSSFLSQSINTGTMTPAVRSRDMAMGRESFAPGASLIVPGNDSQSQHSRSLSRQPSRRRGQKREQQEDEEAMASQMDPDAFQADAPSQGLAAAGGARRESRRISSLVSRADSTASSAHPHPFTTSFNGGRRQTSFGPGAGLGSQHERRSFGPRRSRASTPGSSVFRASVGLEDDSTVNLSLDDAEGGEASVEAVVRCVRASIEAGGVENVFGAIEEEGGRPEMCVRKVHSFALAQQCGEAAEDSVKVATLCETLPELDREEQRMGVYVHDRATGELHTLSLDLRERALWPETPTLPKAVVPVVTGNETVQQCGDMVKLRDGTTTALLVGGKGLLTSPRGLDFCPLPASSEYGRMNKLYHNLAPLSADGKDEYADVLTTEGKLKLAYPGANGTFTEVASSNTAHRRQVKLVPQDSHIADVLKVCRLVLPAELAVCVMQVWCRAHSDLVERPGLLGGTGWEEQGEWVACVATVFHFIIQLVGEAGKKELMRRERSPGTARQGNRTEKRQRGDLTRMFGSPAWSWMGDLAPLSSSQATSPQGTSQKDQLLPIAASLALELQQQTPAKRIELASTADTATKLMLALHVFREERKLNTLISAGGRDLSPVIAQLGTWLGLEAWSLRAGTYYNFEGADEARWEVVQSKPASRIEMPLMDEPVGVFQWIEHAYKHGATEQYPSIATIAQLGSDVAVWQAFEKAALDMSPRTSAFGRVLAETQGLTATPEAIVKAGATYGFTNEVLETLPEAVAAPFREAVTRCERDPPTTWTPELLRLIGRDDLVLGDESVTAHRPFGGQQGAVQGVKDVQSVCHALEQPIHAVKTREAVRHAVSQLLFSEDRRLVEATSLMHFHAVQIAECPKAPEWSDAFHFEQQRRVMAWVTTRMIALPAGDGMIHYDSQAPLMTEKYHLPGFSSSAVMQPMGHTVTTDRSGLTEEKVNWAYFHAGVASGLRISKGSGGVDTSWLVFNKPAELTNRHAGLLLALGLSGHLRNLAKWLSFKYLTPKHSMTSVGLLLGLSASYMGTMDSLITRMLSVHVTSMLPLGAAELNVSPMTQTAGLMGIGLLYYGTGHRRMSEVMLHEIENMDVEDVDAGPDVLRDESYRLAAGFALGFMNLAKGADLRGLYGMRLPERLLGVAVGPKPVEKVHIADKTTAGAIVAVALVYMKSGDETVAKKIDIPDAEPQFDQVRPDMLMLRSAAKHLIMWHKISAQGAMDGVPGWISANLPPCYKGKLAALRGLRGWRATLQSKDVPFFNIATGLAWALSLRYAGSGNENARDEILALLDAFHNVKVKGEAYYYDAKLARTSLRRCIDTLALAAATVMSGTGDLVTFRYLRRLHGRVDAETPYGSHLAAHLAIGALFLGGGTYAFGTSDLATSALVVAFYPLFPTEVGDCRTHLQALRHFWVFAAEPRCLVVEDVDTRRPIPMPLTLILRSGAAEKTVQSPCLLPDLETIEKITTADPAFWPVTLDFARNPKHLEAFRRNQRIAVRKCPAIEAHSSLFGATLASLQHPLSLPPSPTTYPGGRDIWSWVFDLASLRDVLIKADTDLILPPDLRSGVYTDARQTAVDDRLVLAGYVESADRDRLWGLRVLFAWAARVKEEGEGGTRWLGGEGIEGFKGAVEARGRRELGGDGAASTA